jgi:NADH-quinone oxidoreductase subunit G
LTRLTEHIGSKNIDYRLRTTDFRHQDSDPVWPWLGTSIADLENYDSILVVGSNLRMEVPIVAHRVRKAALKGAAVGFVNPEAYEYHFPRATLVQAPLAQLLAALAGVADAAREMGTAATDAQRTAAEMLRGKQKSLVLLGQIAQRHPQAADLRAVAAALCKATGAQLGYLPEGANAVGAALAGALPHRSVGGRARDAAGRHAQAMLSAPRRVYALFGLEPDRDLADGELAVQALKAADNVVCFTPYVTDTLLECADILLPIGTFAETAGTFVNAEGRWQSFSAAARLVGESREGWRVLRVLGNALGLPNCEYQVPADILDALKAAAGTVDADNSYRGSWDPSGDPVDRVDEGIDVPIYSVDAIVRRSAPLQLTPLGAELTGNPERAAEA